MVDVDGVLIVHPDQGGWSANLERDFGIAPARLQSAFFSRHWDDIVNGRAALRDRLALVLREIAPAMSCDVLIDYWFSNDAHLNRDLLAELSAIRAGGTEVHLATLQEHERGRYLWDTLDLRSECDGLHYSAQLGCSKPDPAFYHAVQAHTGFGADAIFFIDDKPANVAAAQSCGWRAAVWTGCDTLRSLLVNYALSRAIRTSATVPAQNG